ncbi:MAG TPA: MarR family transcriptional regulator [Jiangellaceae bacterium]|nr:MarR family transcriptional regulator [Jiangellaceae bacterium]
MYSDEVEEIVAAWSREQPGTDVSSIRIVTPLWRLSTALRSARQSVLLAHGMDHSSLDVLGALRRSGPPYRLTAGELSRRCRVTAGATTQRVIPLEEAGFVRRLRDEPDRRTVYVELTPVGSARLDEIFADVMAADEGVLATLNPTDRNDLQRILGAWMRGAGLDHTAPDRR